MRTNAVQVAMEAGEAGRRLIAGATVRGGSALPAARLVFLPLGPCMLGVAWNPWDAGTLISYRLPDGCEHLDELAESELDAMLEAPPVVGGASWQTMALVALLVLGATMILWGGRR